MAQCAGSIAVAAGRRGLAALLLPCWAIAAALGSWGVQPAGRLRLQVPRFGAGVLYCRGLDPQCGCRWVGRCDDCECADGGLRDAAHVADTAGSEGEAACGVWSGACTLAKDGAVAAMRRSCVGAQPAAAAKAVVATHVQYWAPWPRPPTWGRISYTSHPRLG